MQELTEHDIQASAGDTLLGDMFFCKLREQDPNGCSKLVDTITAKAEGVFLWVHLVVRSLLRGLNNDDDLGILERRISEYPETLEAYYQRMFDRIEKVYQTHSARIMLAALAGNDDLSFWAPRCLELELACPDYAGLLPVPRIDPDTVKVVLRSDYRYEDFPRLRGKCLHDWTDYLSNRYITQHRVKLRRYLDGRCADFLEIVASGIQFIHRTARDFPDKTGSSITLCQRAGADYDVGLPFARLRLADIKTTSGDTLYQRRMLDRLVALAGCVNPDRVKDYLALLDHLHQVGHASGIQQLDAVLLDGMLLVSSKVDKELCVHRPVRFNGQGVLYVGPREFAPRPGAEPLRTLNCETELTNREIGVLQSRLFRFLPLPVGEMGIAM